MLREPMGLSRTHARTFLNRHGANNNTREDICYPPRTQISVTNFRRMCWGNCISISEKKKKDEALNDEFSHFS